jgi:hypothetical protein
MKRLQQGNVLNNKMTKGTKCPKEQNNQRIELPTGTK